MAFEMDIDAMLEGVAGTDEPDSKKRRADDGKVKSKNVEDMMQQLTLKEHGRDHTPLQGS